MNSKSNDLIINVPLVIVTMITVCLTITAPLTNAMDRNHSHNLNKVIGDINVHEGEQMGDLKSVNGSIYLDNSAIAEDVSTVNGSIKIDDSVTLASVETVNGSIRAGTNLQVEGNVKTVNGGITLRAGSTVNEVATVNGDIDLTMTQVEEDVTTLNGNITLTESSKVQGDIVFDEVRKYFDRSIPTLTIDATSSVGGTIHLYQKVRLKISESASVGEIIHHYN